MDVGDGRTPGLPLRKGADTVYGAKRQASLLQMTVHEEWATQAY